MKVKTDSRCCLIEYAEYAEIYIHIDQDLSQFLFSQLNLLGCHGCYLDIPLHPEIMDPQ